MTTVVVSTSSLRLASPHRRDGLFSAGWLAPRRSLARRRLPPRPALAAVPRRAVTSRAQQAVAPVVVVGWFSRPRRPPSARSPSASHGASPAARPAAPAPGAAAVQLQAQTRPGLSGRVIAQVPPACANRACRELAGPLWPKKSCTPAAQPKKSCTPAAQERKGPPPCHTPSGRRPAGSRRLHVERQACLSPLQQLNEFGLAGRLGRKGGGDLLRAHQPLAQRAGRRRARLLTQLRERVLPQAAGAKRVAAAELERWRGPVALHADRTLVAAVLDAVQVLLGHVGDEIIDGETRRHFSW